MGRMTTVIAAHSSESASYHSHYSELSPVSPLTHSEVVLPARHSAVSSQVKTNQPTQDDSRGKLYSSQVAKQGELP